MLCESPCTSTFRRGGGWRYFQELLFEVPWRNEPFYLHAHIILCNETIKKLPCRKWQGSFVNEYCLSRISETFYQG